MAQEIAVATEKKQEYQPSEALAPSTQTISMSPDQLQQIIISAVSAATNSIGDKIANAMIESRKPYVDPAQEENARRDRESARKQQERIRQQVEADRDTCPHLQGSNALSEFQGQLTSFVLHRLDTGEMIGICTNCQKLISSLNPEDRPFFQRKSGNRMSMGGQRNFVDPLAAQRARLGEAA